MTKGWWLSLLDKLKFLNHLADLNKNNNAKNLKKDNKILVQLKTKRCGSFASKKANVLNYSNYIPNDNESFIMENFVFQFLNIKCLVKVFFRF